MVDLFLILILNGLFCTGLFISFQFNNYETFDDLEDHSWHGYPSGKMLLWRVRWYGKQYLPEFWRKPVYMCLPCMGSLYSLPFWVPFCIFMGWGFWPSLAGWFLYAPALVGLNKAIKYNLLD